MTTIQGQASVLSFVAFGAEGALEAVQDRVSDLLFSEPTRQAPDAPEP
jgi:hypothetical protein